MPELKPTCDFCGEQFKNEIDLDAHKFNSCCEDEEPEMPESKVLCERCGYPENTHPRTTCWGKEGE